MLPVWRGERAFSNRRDPGQEHAVLRVREPDGGRRVLIDPIALDPTGTTTRLCSVIGKEVRK